MGRSLGIQAIEFKPNSEPKLVGGRVAQAPGRDNVKIPSNGGLNPSPTDSFSPPLPLGNPPVLSPLIAGP
jgi:hypothetical protein